MCAEPSLPDLSFQEIASRAVVEMYPYHDITVALVAWNEAERLPRLLDHLRPWFETVAVGVQRSTDGSEAIASEKADVIVFDDHRGFGDATFGPRLLPQVNSRWTFKVDCDEWPSVDLLSSLGHAIWYLQQHGLDGAWVPFRSSVDGIEYEEQHGHLRLFRTEIGWPKTLHSRPPTENTIWWPQGHIRHDRTLDEMMQDYLRYWYAGLGHAQWEAHNALMMRSACTGVAEKRGWDYVRSYPWWTEVEAIAFSNKEF